MTPHIQVTNGRARFYIKNKEDQSAGKCTEMEKLDEVGFLG